MSNGCLKLRRESKAVCVITITLWIFHYIYKMAAKRLTGVSMLEKGLVGVLREMEGDNMKFHPFIEERMFFELTNYLALEFFI